MENAQSNGTINVDVSGKDLNVPTTDFVANLTLQELKEDLSKTPAKIAYWLSVKASMKLKLVELEQEYVDKTDVVYARISKNMLKSTETAKNKAVKFEMGNDFKEYIQSKNTLELNLSKCNAIITGYEQKMIALRQLSQISVSELSVMGIGIVDKQNKEAK